MSKKHYILIMNANVKRNIVMKLAPCPNPDMQNSVELYVNHGVVPGSFLKAVLKNDFIGAATKSDQKNKELLREWAIYLVNELPDACYGSSEKVSDWAKKMRENV